MSTSRPQIAIVDDEEAVRKALERLLRSAGMNVQTFASGAAFTDSLPAHEPDCVVLDLHMPLMDGFDVLAWLQRSGKRLPIVVITGHDNPGAQAHALQCGAAAFLLKPVDELVLLGAIGAAIKQCRP